MHKVCALIVTAMFCAGALFLCAFTSAPRDTYFTIFYDSESVVITDEFLRGSWYNYEAQKKFAGGKNLYERAKTVSGKNPMKTIQKDFPEIWMIIERISKKVEVKAYDGYIMFYPDNMNKFKVVGQKQGRDLDEVRLCEDILFGLQQGKHFNAIANVKNILPRDEKDILARIGLRGSYTTYFEQNEAREHNIALAFHAFNGLIVQKNETVSFNNVVGPRTRERGYAEAKIILDGQFVPGVGGGVCQASTTLFNAALLSGLKIDKSYNHSLAISYVPIGRDAMVSSAADLRFVNNTGGTIYIEAGVIPATDTKHGSAFVRVYGNKTDVKYRPRTVVTEHELGEDEIDPARESLTYIEAWKDDKLVHSKLVRKSKYKSRCKNTHACPEH